MTEETVRHLGDLLCVYRYDHGRFRQDGHFCRASGRAIAELDRPLLNIGARKFAREKRWEGEACWVGGSRAPARSLTRATRGQACLGPGAEDVLRCQGCGLVLHRACAYGESGVAWLQAERVCTEELEERGFEVPRLPTRIEGAPWTCPMRECQAGRDG